MEGVQAKRSGDGLRCHYALLAIRRQRLPSKSVSASSQPPRPSRPSKTLAAGLMTTGPSAQPEVLVSAMVQS